MTIREQTQAKMERLRSRIARRRGAIDSFTGWRAPELIARVIELQDRMNRLKGKLGAEKALRLKAEQELQRRGR